MARFKFLLIIIISALYSCRTEFKYNQYTNLNIANPSFFKDSIKKWSSAYNKETIDLNVLDTSGAMIKDTVLREFLSKKCFQTSFEDAKYYYLGDILLSNDYCSSLFFRIDSNKYDMMMKEINMVNFNDSIIISRCNLSCLSVVWTGWSYSFSKMKNNGIFIQYFRFNGYRYHILWKSFPRYDKFPFKVDNQGFIVPI